MTARQLLESVRKYTDINTVGDDEDSLTVSTIPGFVLRNFSGDKTTDLALDNTLFNSIFGVFSPTSTINMVCEVCKKSGGECTCDIAFKAAKEKSKSSSSKTSKAVEFSLQEEEIQLTPTNADSIFPVESPPDFGLTLATQDEIEVPDDLGKSLQQELQEIGSFSTAEEEVLPEIIDLNIPDSDTDKGKLAESRDRSDSLKEIVELIKGPPIPATIEAADNVDIDHIYQLAPNEGSLNVIISMMFVLQNKVLSQIRALDDSTKEKLNETINYLSVMTDGILTLQQATRKLNDQMTQTNNRLDEITKKVQTLSVKSIHIEQAQASTSGVKVGVIPVTMPTHVVHSPEDTEITKYICGLLSTPSDREECKIFESYITEFVEKCKTSVGMNTLLKSYFPIETHESLKAVVHVMRTEGVKSPKIAKALKSIHKHFAGLAHKDFETNIPSTSQEVVPHTAIAPDTGELRHQTPLEKLQALAELNRSALSKPSGLRGHTPLLSNATQQVIIRPSGFTPEEIMIYEASKENDETIEEFYSRNG